MLEKSRQGLVANCFIIVLQILLLLSLNQAASAQVKSSCDPHCVQIRIKSNAYAQKPASQDSALSLPEISKMTLEKYCDPAKKSEKNTKISSWTDELKLPESLKRKAGVFVTLSIDGKTRACWGSVYPREASLAKETVLATMGAVSKEYRFKKLSKSELKKLHIQVSVIDSIEAISKYTQINPFRDGVLVRAGGRGGVILPGEATDAYYQVLMAKLKAGIKPEENCQIYKLKVEIYEQSNRK